MNSVEKNSSIPISFFPEIPPTIKKAALVACAVAGTAFLGVQVYRYVSSVSKQRIREKISDYVVIGFTRDAKLSSEELLVKAEAIAVRKRLCSLLIEIANDELPNLSQEKKQDLTKLIGLLNAGFSALDKFSDSSREAGELPFWWSSLEPTIKKEIAHRIQVRYSDDTSFAMEEEKRKQNENAIQQIDSLYSKIIERNKGGLGGALKIAALTLVMENLKKAIKA